MRDEGGGRREEGGGRREVGGGRWEEERVKNKEENFCILRMANSVYLGKLLQ